VAAVAFERATELRLYASLSRLVGECEAEATRPPVAVDVPMGLPRRAGLRACDAEARERLRPRWQCVFPAPDRELLGLTFEGAREVVLRRRTAEPGSHPVMTKQAMAIAPKIAEADALLTADPARQRWLVEAHPELSFRSLAAGALPRKKCLAGRTMRGELMGRVFPDSAERIAAAAWPRSAVGVDDALDAYACLWTALRYGAERGVRLGDGSVDDRGLLAQIVV
jgi:predicted RNase H-like nuclease